ncbi:DUF2147 domain-containing protein [Paraflavisolibacter sp. H34]|uniref:DUF2147 domain-containing protein n=1 Tax=Huijunlia imazamoxiresistens TaxID=3127457 RepID=UPI0030159897
MKKALLLAFSLFLLLPVFAALNPDAIVGIWKNGTGKGHIQIYKQNSRYFGKIIWLKESSDGNGNLKTDRKNSDPGQRQKPLLGLVMLRDFAYEDGEWTGGRIYNPSDGKSYKAYMKMENPNTLVVHGYIGFSFIGKSDTWTRVK